MYYIACPTSSEDFNWIDWWVVGHENKDALGEPLRDLVHNYEQTCLDSEEDYDYEEHDEYYPDLKQMLENNGYLVAITDMVWIEGIYK
jgi:predicted protein tyrosine phosphatase